MPVPTRMLGVGVACVLSALLAGATAEPGLPASHAAHRVTGAVAYTAPLPEPLRVLTPFDPPSTPYGPGHLGVDLAAQQGAVVRSAGPGVVAFAGAVAGRGVVVIDHPDGISTEYEPVRADVRAGTQVQGGTVLGHLDRTHAACAPARCLHWGAKRGDTYLDPLDLLAPLGVVRLLPWPH